MIVTKATTISINPSLKEEYLWWQEHCQELCDEGYVLHEDTTSCWFALLEKSAMYDLRRKENDRD